MLGDDDLGDSPVGRIRVVDVVPVDEHHDVGVLLDGSAVVGDDSVGNKAMGRRHVSVEDFLLARRRDRLDLRPGDAAISSASDRVRWELAHSQCRALHGC